MKTIIKEIDRQSYIQKNKIMVRWSELFGLDFGRKTADDLTFVDLLDMVNDRDGEVVYRELHKIVKHGVTPEQKTFLYGAYSRIMFEDDPYADFETLIERCRGNLASMPNLSGVVIKTQDDEDPSFAGFYVVGVKSSLDVVEYYFETAGLPIEAILLQNGQIMVMSAVSSFDKVAKLQDALARMP